MYTVMLMDFILVEIHMLRGKFGLKKCHMLSMKFLKVLQKVKHACKIGI